MKTFLYNFYIWNKIDLSNSSSFNSKELLLYKFSK